MYLSIIRNETTGRLIMAQADVIATIALLETVALSPDPTPAFPRKLSLYSWLGHVRPTPLSLTPMISGCITPTIMQEALRRTPYHKAAWPDWVPGLALKHMLPARHEALHLLF
jgi:hypothetical protein